MIAQLPAWVPDLAGLCGALLAVAGVVALVLKVTRPSFNKAVGDALQPKFEILGKSIDTTHKDLTSSLDLTHRRIDDLRARVDDTARRLDVHTASEEAATTQLLELLKDRVHPKD